MSKKQKKSLLAAIGFSIAAFGVSGYFAYESAGNKQVIEKLNSSIEKQNIKIQEIEDSIKKSNRDFEKNVETAIEVIVERRQAEAEKEREAKKAANLNTSENGFINKEGFLVYGSEDARFTINIFEDYQCSFCSAYHPQVKGIVDDSGGLINMAYRPFPVLGEESVYLALAAECVLRNEGADAAIRFSEHAYASKNWKTALKYSEIVDLEEVQNCVLSREHYDNIADSLSYGKELGVNGTPASIFVNNETEKAAFVPGKISYNDTLRMLKEVNRE